MFWVPAFVDHLEVRFMAAHNPDQNVCLVLFPKVGTETALSILNRFHNPYLLSLTASQNHSSMSFVLCKMRLIWAQISTTELVVNVKQQKIDDLEKYAGFITEVGSHAKICECARWCCRRPCKITRFVA